MNETSWYQCWLSPILYEPAWTFYQPEMWKWQKPPWWDYHPSHTQIDQNIRYAEKEERRIDRWKQRNLQKTLNAELIDIPLQSKGTGKPYRGPKWSDEIDNEEPLPELAINPRLWDIPRKFNSTVMYDRFWTRKPKKPIVRKLVDVSRYQNTTAEVDYIPFIFFSWPEMPRLSVDERALQETEKDGMILTTELQKKEWDI